MAAIEPIKLSDNFICLRNKNNLSNILAQLPNGLVKISDITEDSSGCYVNGRLVDFIFEDESSRASLIIQDIEDASSTLSLILDGHLLYSKYFSQLPNCEVYLCGDLSSIDSETHSIILPVGDDASNPSPITCYIVGGLFHVRLTHFKCNDNSADVSTKTSCSDKPQLSDFAPEPVMRKFEFTRSSRQYSSPPPPLSQFSHSLPSHSPSPPLLSMPVDSQPPLSPPPSSPPPPPPLSQFSHSLPSHSPSSSMPVDSQPPSSPPHPPPPHPLPPPPPPPPSSPPLPLPPPSSPPLPPPLSQLSNSLPSHSPSSSMPVDSQLPPSSPLHPVSSSNVPLLSEISGEDDDNHDSDNDELDDGLDCSNFEDTVEYIEAYVPIKQARESCSANICGIIVDFESPSRKMSPSGTLQYCCKFTIEDFGKSLIKVYAVHTDEVCVPNIRKTGDVILLKDILISKKQSKRPLQSKIPLALCNGNSKFKVYGGLSDDPAVPYSCSADNDHTDAFEMKIITILKTIPFCFGSLTKFEEFSANKKFHVICRVVCVTELSLRGVKCLSVCDGTKLPFNPSVHRNTSIKDQCQVDENFIKSYESYTYDILLIGEDLKCLDCVVPGQYVHLCNVAAHMSTVSDNSNVCTLEIVFPADNNMTWFRLLENNPIRDTVEDAISGMITTAVTTSMQPVVHHHRVLSSTITITPHSHAPFSTIAEVLVASVPYKHRCLVKAVAITPKKFSSIVKLQSCSSSSFPLTVSSSKATFGKSKEMQDEQLGSSENRVDLTYGYVFMLQLRDHSGALSVGVADVDAINFLGVSPMDFITDKLYANLVLTKLINLFGCNPFSSISVPVDPPLMECCIYSYHDGDSVIYRLADTYFISH